MDFRKASNTKEIILLNSEPGLGLRGEALLEMKPFWKSAQMGSELRRETQELSPSAVMFTSAFHLQSLKGVVTDPVTAVIITSKCMHQICTNWYIALRLSLYMETTNWKKCQQKWAQSLTYCLRLFWIRILDGNLSILHHTDERMVVDIVWDISGKPATLIQLIFLCIILLYQEPKCLFVKWQKKITPKGIQQWIKH